MTIETRLAEIRARCEDATPGPWSFQPGGFYACGEPACCSEDWDNRIRASGTVLLEDYQLTGPDAEFIAHARTDLPALLAAVEAVMGLHTPIERRDGPVCDHCLHSPRMGAYPYPCPTVQALTAALEADTTTREDPS